MRKNTKNEGKTNRTGRLLTAIVLGGLLTSLPLTADAAQQQEFSLDQVVVTAQRTETRELDTPAAVTVITAEEIQASGHATVYEAIEHTVGVSSMSYGPAGGDIGMSAARTQVRGFDKGTLVLVNGSPINLLNYNGTGGIPIEMVERIEVVKGANAVMYGSEALAGVVNIITKKNDGKSRNTVGFGLGNYSSNWHAGSQFDKTSIYAKREFIGDVTRTSRDNLGKKSDGTAIQPYGLNKGNKDSFYLAHDINDRLSLNWSYTDAQINRPRYNADGSNYITYKYADTRNNVNLLYNDAENKFKSVLSYNKRRAYGDKYTYSSNKWAMSERYNMYAINFDNQKSWNFRADKDLLTAGLTLAREHFKNPGEATRKNSRRDSLAAYASYKYEFTPKFDTTLGLRGHIIDDYAKSEQVLLPQVQTNYKLNDHTSWYVNVGRAFQMPPLNQYFSKQNADFSSLDPQQGWTYETGVKIIDNDSSWKFGVYHMDIKDQFVWKKNPDNTDYMTNGGDFKNTGIEVEFAKKLGQNWRYNLGVSYSNPKNNETGSWEQSNSRLQASAGMTFNKAKWLANANFLYVGDREESYYRINGDISDVPSKIQLNANVKYQAADNQVVSLSLYNLLDRDNSVNKYENLDLPFNFVVAYEYTF